MTTEAKTRDRGRSEPVLIKVNTKPVQLPDDHATGREIKDAAIAQGVKIQPDFVLSKEREGHKGKIVGDNDRIKLDEGDEFTAIGPDDNS